MLDVMEYSGNIMENKMDRLGKIDIEELELLKEELAATGEDLDQRSLTMIKDLEYTITNMFLNHQHYCKWATEEMQKLREKNVESSWTANPDRSGGQYTLEEINQRYCNGGW